MKFCIESDSFSIDFYRTRFKSFIGFIQKGIQSEWIQLISKSFSEPIQKIFWITFDAHRFKIKLNQTDSIQAFNPNEFELELKNWFGFIRTEVSDWAGFISNRLASNKIQIVYRICTKRNSIRMNPTYFKICFRTNPKPFWISFDANRFKTKFSQSDSIRMNPRSNSVGNKSGSIRDFSPNESKPIFKIRARIHSDWSLGLNRFYLIILLTNFYQSKSKTFLRLVRIGSEADFEITWIHSD